MTGRDRIMSAVRGRDFGRRAFMPISMSLAADEIGAKYRVYATEWRIQAEGQLAFAEAFGADQVSAISDPGVEASDLGAPLIVPEDEPASLDESRSLLAEKDGFARIAEGGVGRFGPRMENRLDAVSGLSAASRGERMVEGWVEGPCAEAADLRGLSRFMLDLYDDPGFARGLLDFVTERAIAFALAQVAVGAEMIGVGDAASSLIGPELFGDFVLERHRRYVQAIHGSGALARLHICGDTRPLVGQIAALGYDIVDLDSMVGLAEARAAAGPRQVFCGNLDPVRALRCGTPASVAAALEACAGEAGGAWIVGAGCEIPRGTPRENILEMSDFAAGRRG